MKAILSSLAGRKTYLLSGGLVLGVIVLVFMGVVSPVEAVSLIGAAGFAFTFRDALAKHHDAELQILTGIAETGAAALAHNKAAALQAAEATGQEAIQLAGQIRADQASASPVKAVLILLVLLGCAGTLQAQTGCVVDCGCTDSPELPTVLLGFLGAVAVAIWFGVKHGKKEKGN